MMDKSGLKNLHSNPSIQKDEFVILDTFMKQGKIVSRMEEFQKDFFWTTFHYHF